MASHLVFGLPATALLFGLCLTALSRTRREQHAIALFDLEAQRRVVAEDGLRQAQKMEAVGQLTGGVAHDVNNLLLVVNGNAELLKKHVDRDHRRLIEAIQRAVSRGESLTRQLLSFSRRQALQPRVLDLHARMPRMMEMVGRSLRGDIEVMVDVVSDVWLVEADPGELELALLNIAANARGAMPSGGRFSVSVRNVELGPGDARNTGLAGAFVAIALGDTGIGIAPKMLERIFEPFFTTKEVGKGTGLGLSQVYGFAKQSGGAVLAESAPGVGTTVTLFLPRTRKPVPSAEAPSGVSGTRPAGVAILLVEDNPEVAAITETLLATLGHLVTVVDKPRAALDLLADGEKPIDLVISDIIMPGGMSGIELGREIRARYPALPVLLTTGYSQIEVTPDFTVLRKPYTLAALDEAIRALRPPGAIRLAARRE